MVTSLLQPIDKSDEYEISGLNLCLQMDYFATAMVDYLRSGRSKIKKKAMSAFVCGNIIIARAGPCVSVAK